MRTLAPWSGNLRRDLERFFDRFTDPIWEPFETMAGDWAPKLDVSETKDAMIVKADIPGVDPEEIEIRLTGDLLTLKGEREKETAEKEECYHRVERTYGAFLRSVRLPMAVDGSKVTATFKNGVLVLTLPKALASKGTMIPVKAEEEGRRPAGEACLPGGVWCERGKGGEDHDVSRCAAAWRVRAASTPRSPGDLRCAPDHRHGARGPRAATSRRRHRRGGQGDHAARGHSVFARHARGRP
jgi:HSP20 family protein